MVNPGTGEVLRDYSVLLAEMNPPERPKAGTSHDGGGTTTAGVATMTMQGADAVGDGSAVLTDDAMLEVPGLLLIDPVVTSDPDMAEPVTQDPVTPDPVIP